MSWLGYPSTCTVGNPLVQHHSHQVLKSKIFSSGAMVVWKNKCATGNYKWPQGFCYLVAAVETQTAACCRRLFSSDQWLWNCVPFCCQYLKNGVGLSYQSLCQNISLQVQSECDQNFHGTLKLLMKTWINGPLGNLALKTQMLMSHGATCWQQATVAPLFVL